MHRVLRLVGALAAVSCGGEHVARHEWQGTIETLGGRVIVRNSPVGIWGTGESGRLTEELRIGALDGDGPEVFGSVTAIAVSSQGDIAVLEDQTQEVRVFDRRGEHVRTMGRRGEGPGEFGRAIAVHYDHGDRLWVVDMGNARYSVFGPTGEYLRSSRRFAGIAVGNPGMFTDLGLLDPTPRFTPEGEIQMLYVLVDSAGAIADTLPAIPVGHISRLRDVPARLLPFMPRVISAPEPRGDLWLASTDEYALYRRTPAGDTVRMIEVVTSAIELSPEDQDSIDAIIRNWPASVDQGGLHLGAQYLRSLHPDELGRILVRPNIPYEGTDRDFDMFDEQGRYLGRLEADVPFEAMPKVWVQGGAVYGVVLDSLDVPYVVRARLEAPAHSS